MRKPVVAIVGRPNVGKSTLINRILGGRHAIVDDQPGVTRDRAYYDAEWLEHHFTLVDTGGLLPKDDEAMAQKINAHVFAALEEADLILLVVDGQTGVTDIDEDIAKTLRESKKPTLLLVNKIDAVEQSGLTAEFYQLGLGDPRAISAIHGSLGVADALDDVLTHIKALQQEGLSTEPKPTEQLRVAFVGRPNVGKSSIVNQLLGEERHIVSDVSGTTRDAVDTEIEWEGRRLTLVDTAGIRKKSKVAYGVEQFSVDRAIRALRRANVTVLVMDATEGLTDQDKRLIETSNDNGNALVMVVNKWDLIEEKNTMSSKAFEEEIFHAAPHGRFAPIVFTSALTGQRLERILKWVLTVYENSQRRIQTSVINELLMEAYSLSPPHAVKKKALKIYYGTQVNVGPPWFVLFVNDAKLMKENYKRYLERQFRENIELTGTPVWIHCKSKAAK